MLILRLDLKECMVFHSLAWNLASTRSKEPDYPLRVAQMTFSLSADGWGRPNIDDLATVIRTTQPACRPTKQYQVLFFLSYFFFSLLFFSFILFSFFVSLYHFSLLYYLYFNTTYFNVTYIILFILTFLIVSFKRH